MSPSIDTRRLAIIGFGEVGRIFARGFVASGRFDVAVYDILADDAATAGSFAETARSLNVALCASAAAAAQGAQVVISAVTASSARDVAAEAARYLGPGQLFLDINSVSPETKQANAAAVEASGARYVEAAVMAPVAPYGMAVPILLGGAAATDLAALLAPAGMRLEVAGAAIGQASATKMCRSIMVKGLEALAVECLLTARHYGVEDAIVASLDKSYPLDWERLAGYLVGRVVEHGRRRAAEMREAAATIADAGVTPLMAAAAADRQDGVADLAAATPKLKSMTADAWRETLDLMRAGLAAQAGRAVDSDRLARFAPPRGIPFRIAKIGHVVLHVRDVERATRFYTETLGLRVSDVYPAEMVPGGMVFMRCNADHHGIALIGALEGQATHRDLNHLAFEVATLDEVLRARDHLRRQGVSIDFDGRRRAGCQIAVEFRDPDGHRLEIYWGVDQVGSDGTVRPPTEWKGTRSLEAAIADPVRGQDTTLHDKTLMKT